MLHAYCLEGVKAFFNMCSIEGFNIPCVELRGTKPSLEHTFVIVEKQYITLDIELNEELVSMDTKVLIEAMGDYLHVKCKIPKGADNN
jgi:hypothetical protein